MWLFSLYNTRQCIKFTFSINFSFGQSAIFLIGGTNKSIDPSAILLQSGDIVIMAKEARLCYHAVPRIIPAESSPWNQEKLELPGNINDNSSVVDFKYLSNQNELITFMEKSTNDEIWNQFNSYIEESRINMNVRQVLNEREISITDQKCKNS